MKEREHESNEDTEDLLRKFLRTDLKIPKEDEESIQSDRVHRVSARRVSSGTPNSKPRPIIVKLSSFHDKIILSNKTKRIPETVIYGDTRSRDLNSKVELFNVFFSFSLL